MWHFVVLFLVSFLICRTFLFPPTPFVPGIELVVEPRPAVPSTPYSGLSVSFLGYHFTPSSTSRIPVSGS